MKNKVRGNQYNTVIYLYCILNGFIALTKFIKKNRTHDNNKTNYIKNWNFFFSFADGSFVCPVYTIPSQILPITFETSNVGCRAFGSIVGRKRTINIEQTNGRYTLYTPSVRKYWKSIVVQNQKYGSSTIYILETGALKLNLRVGR